MLLVGDDSIFQGLHGMGFQPKRRSKLCFACQYHGMFDDRGEGEYSSIIEIGVDFVSKIEVGNGCAFGIGLVEIGGIDEDSKDHVTSVELASSIWVCGNIIEEFCAFWGI